MWIQRDLLKNFNIESLLEAVFIKGPRQTGKSSLLNRLEPTSNTFLSMDDLHIQQRAQQDPGLLLENSPLPVLIDEVQLAPEIFYEIKRMIDESRRYRQRGMKSISCASFRLTGSNQFLIDSKVKETLAGRVSIFYLLGLSVKELYQFNSDIMLTDVIFKGGFPELWVRKEVNPIFYINDYISTYIEKDIAVSYGVEKRLEFLNVLKLLAARVGELLNYESLSNDSGVSGPTVKSWLSLLETNQIISIVNPYFTNLNKRLIKMPKVYFLDLGLCTRLQSHQESSSILLTPQAGHLFESLVYSEIIKTKFNFLLLYDVFFWRTKDQEEIDFVIEGKDYFILIEVKLSQSNIKTFDIPLALKKIKSKITKYIVVASGEGYTIDSETRCVPIKKLASRLLEDIK